MGIEIVVGQDLVVKDDIVYMKTTKGPEAGGCDLPARGRRLPRPDGLPQRVGAWRAGLVEAYRKGKCSLANAIGTGSPTTR
jgi:uncharacterized circularly permuted ATP-grasp superfamily protein